MPAIVPSQCRSTAADWITADDTLNYTDYHAGLTDSNLTTGGYEVGKPPQRSLRIDFTTPKNYIRAGDTITFRQTTAKKFTGELWALCPYINSTTPTATGVITLAGDQTLPVDLVFTITAEFCAQIADLGSGAWACRLSAYNGHLGSGEIHEVWTDLSTLAEHPRLMLI